MEKIKLKHEEILDFIEEVECVRESSWRWGTSKQFVGEIDGKYYLTPYLRFHYDDGLQDEGDIWLVPAKRVMVETWVPDT